jgi:Fe-S cluster biogenesis protein NfuA/nitrite reductase/ring-hydroxylating ferredoxin subunit
MAGAVDHTDELVARVQQLGAQLESVADPAARATAEELVATVVQMYGAGLERIMAVLAAAGSAGEEIADALAGDGVVASLLLIHDLYPVPLEERVAQALERVRPYMESHGGDVELLGVDDGIARLRLRGSCRSCRASSATLELAVRQALEEAAPDLQGMDVEGAVAADEETAQPSGATLPMAAPAPAPSWFDLDGAAGVAPGRIVAAEVAGTPLVLANVEDTLLAYRNACARCGARLDRGELSAGVLACPSCGARFSLPRAGRCVDDELLQLEPVPLLREREGVMVALSP